MTRSSIFSSYVRPRRAHILTSAALAITTGAILIAGLGCSDSTAPVTGTVSLALTDAAFPFDSVARADIFIVRIDGKMAASDSTNAETGKDSTDTNTDPHKDWVTLATPNQSMNLLDLQGGKTANLGQVSLPVGTYQSFRLIIDVTQSSITLANGTVLTGGAGIVFPSGTRSGIKIKLAQPFVVGAAGSQMVIDFDLGSSFVLRGHSLGQNGLLFKPVVRATASENTGGISGTVHATSALGAAVSGASVEILKAGTALTDTSAANVIATTSTDGSGMYTVKYLQAGSYAVRVTPPATLLNGDALVDNVVVVSGQVTTGTDVVLP